MKQPAYRNVGAEAHSPRRIRPNIFARTIREVLRWRLPVILLWAIVAAAGVTYGLTTARLDMRGDDMIAADPKVAEARRALETAFPGTGEPIVAIVDSTDPRIARITAGNLARALGEDHASFRHVFAPGTGSFFDEYGLLYLDTKAVEDIVRRIEQSSPLYRAIASSPDLTGFAALASQAARAIADGRSPQGLNALFIEASRTVKALIENQRHDLDWPSLVEFSASPDNPRWYVLAVPVASTGVFDPERPAVLRARDIASEVIAKADGPASVTLTGRPVLRAEPGGALARAMLLSALISGLLVIVVLGFGLARTGLIIANLFCLAFGAMAFAGGAALLSPRLDRVSVSAMVIYFGAGALAMISMTLRAEQYEKEEASIASALMLAGHRLGPALFGWALAIPIGCLAAYHTTFLSLGALALVTAAAMSTVFLASMTLLPALLSFMSASYARDDIHWLDVVLDRPAPPVWRALRQGVIATVMVGAILFAALLPQIKVEYETEPRSAGRAAQLFRELAAREPSLLAAAHVLAEPGKRTGDLAVRLASLPEVASVRWIQSFLPPGESEKRAILARLQGALPRLPEQASEADEAKQRTDLALLEENLLVIANDPRSAGDLKQAASDLRRGLALLNTPGPASADTIRRLENALFVRLPLLFERVEKLANMPQLSPDTLDPDIVRHYIGPDGSWRIEVAPRDPAAVSPFANAVLSVAPGAISAAFAERAIPQIMVVGLALIVAGMLAAGLIAALLATRSVLASLRAIVPAMLLVLTAGGGLVLTARSIRAEDISIVVMTVAMSLGAGLIAERWRGQTSSQSHPAPSAAGRAVLVAQLLVAAAFATLMLSGWRMFRNFGEMIAIAVALQAGASLIVAPELVRWTRRRNAE